VEMSWTTKIPTTPGWKYWRRNKTEAWGCLLVIDFQGLFIADDEFCSSVEETGGLWWDAPVPAPGTTFTLEEIGAWLQHLAANKLDDWPQAQLKNSRDGIAATTERNKKEQK